jgi:sulfur-carrier protein
MAQVTLTGPLKTAAGESGPFDIEATTIRGLLQALAVRFPDLAPLIEDGVAVAVDGEIYQDAWLTPVGSQSEVHILPPLAGG